MPKRFIILLTFVLICASTLVAETANKTIRSQEDGEHIYPGKAFLKQKNDAQIRVLFKRIEYDDGTTKERVTVEERNFYTYWDPVTNARVDSLKEQVIASIIVDSIECIPTPLFFADYSSKESNFYRLYGHGVKVWSEGYDPNILKTSPRARSVRKGERFKEDITPEFYQYLCSFFHSNTTCIKQRKYLLDDLKTQYVRVLSTKEFVPKPCCHRVMWDNVYVLADRKRNKTIVFEENMVRDMTQNSFDSHKLQFVPDTLFKYVHSNGWVDGMRTNLSGIGTEMFVRYRITESNDTVVFYVNYRQEKLRTRFYDKKSIDYLQEVMGHKFVIVELPSD